MKLIYRYDNYNYLQFKDCYMILEYSPVDIIFEEKKPVGISIFKGIVTYSKYKYTLTKPYIDDNHYIKFGSRKKYLKENSLKCIIGDHQDFSITPVLQMNLFKDRQNKLYFQFEKYYKYIGLNRLPTDEITRKDPEGEMIDEFVIKCNHNGKTKNYMFYHINIHYSDGVYRFESHLIGKHLDILNAYIFVLYYLGDGSDDITVNDISFEYTNRYDNLPYMNIGNTFDEN